MLAVASMAGCTDSGVHPATAGAPAPQAAPPATTSAASTSPLPPPSRTVDAKCTYAPSNGALPTWARSGFSPPYNSWPFVTSKSGHIIGVLFGDPLHAGTPAPTAPQNKILWIPDDPSAARLSVQGHLVGTNTNVDIGDISFGPSYVDVPTAGCWRFTLHWLEGTDSVDIVYGAA
jgi:hypothetical protein